MGYLLGNVEAIKRGNYINCEVPRTGNISIKKEKKENKYVWPGKKNILRAKVGWFIKIYSLKFVKYIGIIVTISD